MDARHISLSIIIFTKEKFPMKNARISKKQKFALDTFDTASTTLSQAMHRDLGKLNTEYTADPGALKLYMKAQSKAYLKKYVSTVKGELEDEKQTKTFNKFKSVNQHMALFTKADLFLPNDRNTLCSLSIRDDILLRARLVVKSILHPFTEEEWFDECKNSKGSSIGVPYVDTSDERKLTFPISCTKRVTSLLDRYLSYDSLFAEAIQDLNCEFPKQEKYQIVEGSRATTVPKSDTIRRMIAIEPTGNMFFQQGLMAMMYTRMREYGLDVASLPYQHSKLAWRGSITGNLATIDFSSASDCVSRDLLEWLIPPNWFRALDRVTSRRIKIGDEYVDTNMFSTMGNAGTFPLETIIFYSLGMATHLSTTNAKSSFPEFGQRLDVSVFGDDCILPTESASRFIEICNSVGFIVNEEKSFFDVEPGFRESCGSDFYRGRDVRPIYFSEPHMNRRSCFEPWLYTCMNKVIAKYISCFGNLSYLYEKRVFDCFAKLFIVHGISVKLVPCDYPDDAGLKLGFDIERFRLIYPRVSFSRVSKGEHNFYTFLTCSFRYSSERPKHDFLQYSLWLKKPHVTQFLIPSRDPEPFYKVRRKGGYVVARATTSFWLRPPT